VADIVANHCGLAAEMAFLGHGISSCLLEKRYEYHCNH